MLKPVEIASANNAPKRSQIMKKFHGQRKTEQLDAEQIANEDDYEFNYRFYIPNGEDSDASHSDDDGSDSNGSGNSDNLIT